MHVEASSEAILKLWPSAHQKTLISICPSSPLLLGSSDGISVGIMVMAHKLLTKDMNRRNLRAEKLRSFWWLAVWSGLISHVKECPFFDEERKNLQPVCSALPQYFSNLSPHCLAWLVLFLFVHHPQTVPSTALDAFRVEAGSVGVQGFRIIKKVQGCHKYLEINLDNQALIAGFLNKRSRFTSPMSRDIATQFIQNIPSYDVCSKLHIDPGHHGTRANLVFEQITSSARVFDITEIESGRSKKSRPPRPPSESWDEVWKIYHLQVYYYKMSILEEA